MLLLCCGTVETSLDWQDVLTAVNICGGTCGMGGRNRKGQSGRREPSRCVESTAGGLDLGNSSSGDLEKWLGIYFGNNQSC